MYMSMMYISTDLNIMCMSPDLSIQLPKSRKDLPKNVGISRKRVRANTRHSMITSQHLVSQMKLSLDKAKQMMKVATQKGIRSTVYPVTKRYATNHLEIYTLTGCQVSGMCWNY